MITIGLVMNLKVMLLYELISSLDLENMGGILSVINN
jgi:ABC-type polar amino acid transport system ATPase subunit